VYATTSRAEVIVRRMSNSFPSTMPRSCSMSNTSASTLRREPKSRVVNQTKPMALNAPTDPLARTTSVRSWLTVLAAAGLCGRSRPTSALTSADDASGDCRRK